MKKITQINTSNCLRALLMTMLAPGPAFASGCSDSSEAETTGAVETAPGLRIFVDPKTGEITDVPPPGETLESPTPKNGVGGYPEIQQHVRPDGSVVADIGDRFMTELRVEVVDGKVVTCHKQVNDPRKADKKESDEPGPVKDN